MPVRIPDNLPAAGVLESENIFVMSESRAAMQDIRPMKVLILNLMPNKIETETQLLRLLGNTPLQVDIDLLRIHDKESKHTPTDHLNTFYRDFEDVRHRNYDGLIITGAPGTAGFRGGHLLGSYPRNYRLVTGACYLGTVSLLGGPRWFLSPVSTRAQDPC